MARYCIDCRELPSETNCDLLMCGSEEHLVEAAAVHMITAHKHEDSPELREWARRDMKPDKTAAA